MPRVRCSEVSPSRALPHLCQRRSAAAAAGDVRFRPRLARWPRRGRGDLHQFGVLVDASSCDDRSRRTRANRTDHGRRVHRGCRQQATTSQAGLRWQVKRREHLEPLAKLLWPLMGNRRRVQMASCKTLRQVSWPATSPLSRKLSGPAAAWVAGVIEGEGSFSLSRRYSGRINLESTDADIVERVHTLTGGDLYYRPARKQNWKPTAYSCQGRGRTCGASGQNRGWVTDAHLASRSSAAPVGVASERYLGTGRDPRLPQQRHAGLFRCSRAFLLVAPRVGGDGVQPLTSAAT